MTSLLLILCGAAGYALFQLRFNILAWLWSRTKAGRLAAAEQERRQYRLQQSHVHFFSTDEVWPEGKDRKSA